MPELPPNQESETAFFENISKTAEWPAFCRGRFTDIPFAADIFEELAKIKHRFNATKEIPSASRVRIPLFEARHKLVDKILEEEHVEQVFEIASGYSSRGMMMADASAYVAFDLPRVTKEMKEIVEHLVERAICTPRDNLFFEAGNALQLSDLESAASHFELSKPVAVITEGFIGHLETLDRKQKFGEHIYALLKKYGGVWILPAIPPPRRERTAHNNRARSRDLYERIGFVIEERSVAEMEPQLASIGRLQLSGRELEELREDFTYAPSFVMHLAS